MLSHPISRPYTPITPAAEPGHDSADTLAQPHMREILLKFDPNVADRVFAHDPEDPQKPMLLELPRVGTVFVQVDTPLLQGVFHAFLDELDLLARPENVMLGVALLGMTVQLWACDFGHPLDPGATCDMVLRWGGVEPLFYRAQLLPAAGRLPPILLLEHREPTADERS